ncbi:MAG: ABC transporter ATP-binding protein [Lachnospiraceae bacterium]|nr:ABC transporter ATP-binding protein [Lachnospiraceae bacterium]
MKNKSLLWQMRKWVVPYTLSTVMVACRNFLTTWLLAFIGSRVLNLVNDGKAEEFFPQTMLLLLFIAAFMVFDTTGLFWQSVTMHGIKNDLRSILYEKVLKARYDRVYDMGQKGELLSRLNSDVETASSILGFGILTPLMFLISGIGATVTIAMIHWKLCILIYVVGIVCLGVQAYIIRRQRRTIQLLQENRAEALGMCGENFQNGLTIRLCNLAEAFEEKILQNLGVFEKLSRRFAWQKTAEGLGGTLLQYLQSVGILFVGFFLYQRGELLLGDIVMIYQMAALITYMLSTISSSYAGIQSWIVGFGRLHDILDLEEEEDASGAKELTFDTEADDGIRARNILCRLGDITVHENLNLSLEKRGIYMIAGESGKGKTTFFRLITGIYPYESGELGLFGHSQKEYTLKSLRGQITYMTQENALFQGTIRDNILWRNKATDAEIMELLQRLGLDEWISGMEKGLDTHISNGGNEFSGGQRKCLLWARTLLEHSPVYLLDEGFAGVDERRTGLIWRELEALSQRALVVVITHDQLMMEEALKDGRQLLQI